MHGESLEDDYRAKAAEIGMEEVDAKIAKAYTSPQTSKYLQGIYEARQSVESKASEVKEMKSKVSKMRIEEGTLNMERLDLRTQERNLDDQARISSSLLHTDIVWTFSRENTKSPCTSLINTPE